MYNVLRGTGLTRCSRKDMANGQDYVFYSFKFYFH